MTALLISVLPLVATAISHMNNSVEVSEEVYDLR